MEKCPMRMKAIIWIAFALLILGFCFLGEHHDWTIIVISVPVWAIPGMLIMFFIGNKFPSTNVMFLPICLGVMVLNISLILVHRDTSFIIGRVIHSVACLLISIEQIWEICYMLDKAEKKIKEVEHEKSEYRNKASEIISKLKVENTQLKQKNDA